MNWLEKETIRRIGAMGFKVDGLLNPVIILPPALVNKYSTIIEDVEIEGEENADE